MDPVGPNRFGAATRGFVGAMLLLFSLVISTVAAGPVYPVKISASGRYLVDQNNTPLLMTGDSPQAIVVKTSVADAAFFLADRATNGFNTTWPPLILAVVKKLETATSCK